MEWLEIVKDLNAGTIGGVAGIIAGYPLDTVKVRLQTSDALQRSSISQTIRQIIVSEGPRGLFKGLLSPILSNAPINAVIFGVQGSVGRAIENYKYKQYRYPLGNTTATYSGGLTSFEQFIAGSTAGAAQVVFAAPSEHVKIQIQVNESSVMQQSTIDCGKAILKRHGWKGLFRGWEICLLRDVPSFGVYFFTYDVTKKFLSGGNPDNESNMKLLFAGGLAGTLSWFICQPIDVVKSCIQGQSFTNQKSVRELVQSHYALEGPSFFLKGFGATMLRAFPVSAVTFLVYEKVMKHMS